MKHQHFLCGVALAVALAVVAGPVLSGDAKKSKPSKKPAKAEEPFAAMIKYGTPGPEHKTLDALAGSWKARVKFWMDPSQPPVESEGTIERKWIMGGRFLEEHFKGDAGGQAFTGLGLVGYDKLKKKYSYAWIDSMTTAISTSDGTYDAAKKTFTFVNEALDPYSGRKTKNRDVTRILSADRHVSEMYKTPSGGKEFKVLEIDYRRKK
jgi:hypothetical protein